MQTQTKIYIALGVAAIIAAALIGSSLWASRKIARLERDIDAAREQASVAENAAAIREIEAAEYKAKIEYLENRIVAIQTIARKQDEELEKLNSNSGRARADLERARRTRPIATNTDELCAKLAAVGHPCE